jgi:ANTAR domain
MNGSGSAHGDRGEDVVVRKAEHGWVVGDEEVSDLTSAMVLADLFAADHDPAAYEEGRTAGSGGSAGSGGPDSETAATRPERRPDAGGRPSVSGQPKPQFIPKADTDTDEAARLAVTVTQLEHALASRVRVEQAIGVLAERHRLRPREAFDLLRGAARSRGQRVTDIAQDVVASTANPLLRLPEELARQVPQVKQRGRRRSAAR